MDEMLACLYVTLLVWGCLFSKVIFGSELTILTDDNNKVEFHAEAIGGLLDIDAKGGKVDGTITLADDKVSGVLKVKLSDFKTGIEMRDNHMKDKYLEVSKYPEAILFLDPAKSSNNFEWKGLLEIKGQKAKITGKAKNETIEGKIKTEAEFKVKLSDYPVIGVPQYKDLTVKDEIIIKVKFTSIEKK